MDEALGSYVEDTDFGLRVGDHGWKVVVVPAAQVRGQGSAATDYTVRIDVNSLLVAVKRNGLRAAPTILARYVLWVAQGVVSAAWPGRSPARRRASLVHARDHARALLQIVRRLPDLRRMARDPNYGVPSFKDI